MGKQCVHERILKNTDLISIQKTVENHTEIMPYLPAYHVLTGCDTVPQMFRIGKKKAPKAGKQIPNPIG